MNKKEKILALIERLEGLYPDAVCALEYGGDPWRLLVMGRLSAQCTDARVNEVCRTLFKELPDITDFANVELETLEGLIRPCGLYHTKAKSLQEAAVMVLSDFDGKIPDNMEDLVKIPGVGRKIANLLLGDLFGQPAIVADTHCIRLSGRFGLVKKGEKDPYKVELALKKVTPPEKSSDFCHRLVLFGREVCTARSPKCSGCPMQDLCVYKA
ncbi:MAG: endonuclease III [Clostridiales bacterium]|nr:endonuclease III [Clostridiales bacterium]